MSGWIALHGGGEFQAGDEAFLETLLRRAAPSRRSFAGDTGDGTSSEATLLVAIVPTAAARGRPDLAGAHGQAAFERVAATLGTAVGHVAVDVVPIADAASAADPGLAARLRRAQVIHLPGGDPDLLPSILPGTAALEAMRQAHAAGAILAGASAGAMALADPCWTPTGLVRGLGFVPGVVVVPHADAAGWARVRARSDRERPPGVGVLGLAERTGVIGRVGSAWLVAGEGQARWLGPERDRDEDPVVAGPGDELLLA